MELVYYRLTFINQKEFLVTLDSSLKNTFLKWLNKGESVSLQMNESTSLPVVFLPGTLFTYQQVTKDILGAQSRTWSVVL